MIEINADETLDDLIVSDLKIIQKKSGFRLTVDAVLLAHFASLKKGDRIIDLGTGTGVIPLLLLTRLQGLEITAIDIQKDLVEMATRTLELNKIDNVQMLAGDFRKISREHWGRYSLVISNPPYLPLHRGQISPRLDVALARHELKCNLNELLTTAERLLKNGGRFALIHRSERLAEIMQVFGAHKIEPKRICPVYPQINKPCNLVLIEGVKRGQPGLKVEQPLVIYDARGEYTEEILNLYYGGDYYA